VGAECLLSYPNYTVGLLTSPIFKTVCRMRGLLNPQQLGITSNTNSDGHIFCYDADCNLRGLWKHRSFLSLGLSDGVQNRHSDVVLPYEVASNVNTMVLGCFKIIAGKPLL
jgi:hypothetical protein